MEPTVKSLSLLYLTLFATIACDAGSSNTLVDDDSNSIETTIENSVETTVENSDTSSTNLPDTSSIPDAGAELDGRWVSACITSTAESSAQEHLLIEGSSYQRTINWHKDSNCSVPDTISFLRIRTTSLQTPGGTVQTELGTATQIVVTAPRIDFDRSQLSTNDAELYDPGFYFYEFYILGADGRLRFGSMNTYPADEFEQTLDSPHIFTKQ